MRTRTGMKNRICVVLAFGLACVGIARGAVNWLPTAGGEYTFTDSANWSGSYTTTADLRVSGLTGDQTIHIPSPLSIGQFYPGAGDNTPYWQIFTGSSLTPSSNFRLMGGNVAFENEVTVRMDNWIGYIRPTRLLLRNGGKLTVMNANLIVSYPYSASLAGDTSIFLEEGGTLHLSSGRSILLQNANGSHETHSAYFRQDGGTLRSDSTAGSFLQVGRCRQNYAQYDFLGGKITIATNTTDSQNIQVGSWGLNAGAYWEGNSGFLSTNFCVQVGLWSDGVQGGHADLTVANGGYLRSARFHMGYRGTGNTAALNLNEGGTLCVDREFSLGNNGNTCWMNFDGGKLSIPNGVSNWGAQNGRTVFYPGGGTIDMGGQSTTRSLSFRSAGGYGVGSITLDSAGSGYVAAPRVTISGGSGSNATAVAIVNRAGAVERLVLTCRGEGYAADDTLTVSFASKSGSGAAATVTLAENTPGTWTSDCNYNCTWNQNATNWFDGNLRIQRGYVNLGAAGGFPNLRTLELSGGQFTEKQTVTENSLSTNATLAFLSADRETTYRFCFAKTADTTNSQEFATLFARDGLGRITAANTENDDTEGYSLRFRNYMREYGLVDISTNHLLSVTLDATEHLSSSTVSPVVNGLFNMTSLLLFERDADGRLSIAPKTTTFSEDANFIAPSGTTRLDASAVNSVSFGNSGEQQLYLNHAGNVEIKSGMILAETPTSDQNKVLRLVNEQGGITTRAPGGMVIIDKNTGSRIGYNNRRFLMGGPFVDPDAETPMQVTLAGVSVDAVNLGRSPNPGTPGYGALIWMLSNNNSFSGGLNLIHAGLVIGSDASLGAAGSPLRVSGNSSLSCYNNAINISANHPIEIHRNASFQLQPWVTSNGRVNTIASPISGEGSFLLGCGDRNEVFALTGNQDGFTGDYYVCSSVRGNNFGPRAKIHLTSADMGANGTLETSGTFTRPIGTGPGEISWVKHTAFTAVQGGFSAYGGDLTVNLGGEGATLLVGSDAFPSSMRLVLQNSWANGNLTFENNIDLNGIMVPVLIASGKTATLSGDVLDDTGTGGIFLRSPGTLELAGNVASNVTFAGTFGGGLKIASGNSVTLSGAQRYDGTTTIPATSQLCLIGLHTNSGPYAVSGTLAGDAAIVPSASGKAFTFASGSTIEPGANEEPGELSFGEEGKTGVFALDGVTFAMNLASAANHDAVAFHGAATLSGTIRFEIDATAETFRSLQRTVLPLVTFSEAPAGTFTTEVDQEDWRVALRNNALCLIYGRGGTIIAIR